MNQAMLKMMAASVVVGFLGSSAASAQVMAPITYTGSFTGSRGGDTLTTNYTITTDGTIGTLATNNIAAFTVNFVYNGVPDIANSFTSSTAGAGFSLRENPITASLNDLIFDFSSRSGRIELLQFYKSDYVQIEFDNNNPGDPFYSDSFERAFDGDGVGFNTSVPPVNKVIASVVPVIRPVAAVPEPATWGMMILGLGAVGYAMRRRQKVTTRVVFA